MNEEQWLCCTDPMLMLQFMRDGGTFSDRKARLLAVAACRRLWPLLIDERSRNAVLAAEGYAAGTVSAAQLEQACANAEFAVLEEATRYATAAAASAADQADFEYDLLHHVESALEDASWAAYSAAHAAALKEMPDNERTAAHYEVCWDAGHTAAEVERLAHAVLLQDSIGNPFRPLPPIDSAWLAWHDGTVKKLAEVIYQDKAFERMPVLGDALEDAGCTDADILNHCREPGQHVRGCWVIDLLLGKS